MGGHLGAHHIFCLDASSCSSLSEDWGPALTRFHLQKELVACLSRSCLSDAAPAGGDADAPPGQQAVLIASSGGRADVALHPSGAAAVLQRALGELQPGGETNLEAALKLALLVSRRFAPGSTRVTAFVASPGAAAGLAAGGSTAAAGQLRRRFAAAGTALDVAVLCPRAELGAGAAAALEALAGGGSGDVVAAPLAAAQPSTRLVWLQPVADAAESWQQLEPALEQLEGGRGGGGGAEGGPASSPVAALPRRISRAPRQFDPLRHPRAPLLALRSGVQQPALCRGESLNRLGHLSSDGMARPWLPTYASIGQQAAAAAAGGGAALESGVGEARDVVYVEVQPIPKWRTLARVAAGRLAPSPGDGAFAAASSQLLRSLETLDILDVAEEGEQRSRSSSSSAGESGSGSRQSSGGGGEGGGAAVRFRPDGRRGTLRLLQATKEPELLKLAWSADASLAAAAPQQPPLDMFAAAAPGGGGGGGAAHASLLGYMPAAAVAASAARGPLLREGCELWEAAAEWEWEQVLPAGRPGSVGSSGGGGADGPEAPAALQALQLPNGAQVLLVRAAAREGSGCPAPAAFWLQQQLAPGSLRPPVYGTLGDAAAAAGAAEQPGTERGQPGAADLLAAALLRLLRRPPAVDLRRLRRDVKAGAIPVTPITVGPLPAQFVRDIVATRSALMGGAGVENLDSWDGGEGASGGAAGAAAADRPRSAAAAAAAAVAQRQHKGAVLSLLRQRLQATRHQAGAALAAAGHAAAQAATGGACGEQPTGQVAATPAAAIPGTPQPQPGAAAGGSCGSSASGTPFGTPLHILPTRLLHRCGGHETPPAVDAPGGSAPGPGAGCLPGEGVKQEGPAVLVGAAQQGDGGESEPPMFQLE